MKISYLILLIFITTMKINSLDGDYKLILSSDCKIVQITDSIVLKLTIKGKGIKNIYQTDLNIKDNNDLKVDEFINSIKITPEKSGEMTFGPYFIIFQGNVLESNTLKIVVTETVDNGQIFIKSDKNEVEVNEKFKIVLSSKKNILNQIKMKLSNNYSFSYGVNSSTYSLQDGVAFQNYSIEIFVTPLVSGKLKINKNNFSSIEYNIPEIEIIVNEKRTF